MYRNGQVAAQLDISPTTLRRLSERFAAWLSEGAGQPALLDKGRHAARLYTDEDVATLSFIQELRGGGHNEEEIEAQLQARAAIAKPLPIQTQTRGGHLLLSEDAANAMELIQQAVEGHQALVTAQHAQRELLGAVLHDAIALKDENERLRKRLRVMEEDMSHLKESDWNHRLTLEERMSQLEQAVTAPQKRPWWQRFFGR